MNPKVITRKNVDRLTQIARAQRGWISHLVWSPNSRFLAVASAQGISFHDSKKLAIMGKLEGHGGPVKGIAVNKSGTVLVSGSADTTVRMWDLKEGGQSRVFSGHEDSVEMVALSPDGAVVASGSADGSARLWSADFGQSLTTINAHVAEINDLAFSPDGTLLATGGRDDAARLWDIASLSMRWELPHDDWVRALAFSPDGSLLAAASKDMTVRLWDMQTGTEKAVLLAHFGGADAVAFSPDGSLLATSGRDMAIRLWDVGEALHTGKADRGGALLGIEAHEKPVLTLAFSPDGTFLATGSGDNTLRLWGIG